MLRARVQVHLAAARTRQALEREQRARVEAENESRAAHRAKSDLLASMGHEIRTPMTAILGMSHLALQSGLNPKQRNYVEKVERSAELLLGTLNDILDSSRIDAGTLELQRAPFELADLLDSVGRLVALRAEDKGLELLFDVPRDLPPTLIGDLSRLGQVLVNLGLDAVRAGQHGEIVIGVEPVDVNGTRAVLRFAVRDTGSGVADSPATGPDLGATLSRQLLRLMGSELIVTPQAGPAHSVHFTIAFDLPLAKTGAEGAGRRGRRRGPRADRRRQRQRAANPVGHVRHLGLQAEAPATAGMPCAWPRMRSASADYDLVLLDWEDAGHGRHRMRPPPARRPPPAAGDPDAHRFRPARRDAAPDGPACFGARRARQAGDTGGARRRGRLGPAAQRPAAERVADRAQAMREITARLRGARILLVEDNAIIQELALELLSSAGMLVSLAENGREALERLAKQTFDGVLMDCQMPVLDGYETTRALRAMPHLKDLPVIALTANAMEGDRDRVIAAGMNDHIPAARRGPAVRDPGALGAAGTGRRRST